MKLLYPSSNIIQHAGIMSVQGTPVYKLQYRRNAETQYFGFNKGIRNVLAVTGACMMVRKELFDKVGGFDEERYPHCYSDIDFCYRIHEQGFYNVVRNNMYLFYHEASAPVEEVRRQRELQRDSELEILRAAHPELSARDPFYHKYLTQNIKEARFILDAGSLTI
jgi:GT2 family glycosyltransferase